MLVDPARRLVALHNPKAAGTAVKAALSAALGIDRAEALRRRRLAEHLTYRQARGALAGQVNLDDCLVLAVVRDPLERLASFWRFGRAPAADGKGCRVERGLRHLGLPPAEVEAHADRARAADLEGWVRWCLEMGWCPWRELLPGPAVIARPQVEWAAPGVRVFRAERLDEMADWLRRALGIEVGFERLNESGDERPEFTPWVVDWARRAYAADYELLAGL